MKTKTKKNYPYQAAGRTWTVPELRLISLPDGTAAISEEEIYRIHRAIANEICGSDTTLSMDELEFLCDLTDKSFSDVADCLQIHRQHGHSMAEIWRSTEKRDEFGTQEMVLVPPFRRISPRRSGPT